MAAGVDTFVYRGRTMHAFAEPEIVSVADAFMEHALIDLPATLNGAGQRDRDLLARGGGAPRHPRHRGRHLVRHFQQGPERGDRAEARPWPADHSHRLSRLGSRLGPPKGATIRASPSASSCLPAASSSPTPSASSPTPPSSAGGSRRRSRRALASTARATRSTRISSPRWRRCRRPAGIALGFDRLVMLASARRADRAGSVGAGCRRHGVSEADRTLRRPADLAAAGLIARPCISPSSSSSPPAMRSPCRQRSRG